MSSVNRKPDSIVGGVLFLAVLVTFAAAALSWTVLEWFGTSEWAFVSPLNDDLTLKDWGVGQSILVGVIAALMLAAVVAAAKPWKGSTPVIDRAAPYMSGAGKGYVLGSGHVNKTNKRLGLDPKKHVGIIIGRAVATGRKLYASFESTITMIAPPRRSKTASIVIPNVLIAPGICLNTSVKPDVVDATLGYRSTLGAAYIFDPEGMVTDPRAKQFAVWWNPLRTLRTIEDAAELAAVLVASYTPEDKQDFFPTEGKRLLADYLLAAAVAGRYLPTVFTWLQKDNEQEPVRILRENWPDVAARISSAQNVTERTRSGIFSYARGAVSFLASPAIRSWCTPEIGRSEFDAQRMLDTNAGTLYLLSREGAVSAAPLVSALTKHVLDVAERHAERQPGGRLPIPLLAILDEAGNIVRIPDLPARYSHYGSRGIIPITILQSYEQGEKTWPDGGFATLWAASTVQIFGGGNAAQKFLDDLSKAIGDYEYQEKSVSANGNGKSTSTSKRLERILSESDLRSAEQGRLIVLPSGAAAVLVKAGNWFKDKAMKEKVKTPIADLRRPTIEEPDE